MLLTQGTILLDHGIKVLNAHVVENEFIQASLLDSIRHGKSATISFLDSKLGPLVNVSQVVESVVKLRQNNATLNQSIFPKSEKLLVEVVFGNSTFSFSHFYDASLELYSYFKGKTGISIESSHLKTAGTVANQFLSGSVLVFMWIFYILNYSFDLLFKVSLTVTQVALFFLTLYSCVSDKHGAVHYFSSLLKILDSDSTLR